MNLNQLLYPTSVRPWLCHATTLNFHVEQGSLSTNHELASQTHHQMPLMMMTFDDEFVKPIRGW